MSSTVFAVVSVFHVWIHTIFNDMEKATAGAWCTTTTTRMDAVSLIARGQLIHTRTHTHMTHRLLWACVCMCVRNLTKNVRLACNFMYARLLARARAKWTAFSERRAKSGWLAANLVGAGLERAIEMRQFYMQQFWQAMNNVRARENVIKVARRTELMGGPSLHILFSKDMKFIVVVARCSLCMPCHAPASTAVPM